MKKILKFLTSRLFLVGLLIFVQLSILLLGLFFLVNYYYLYGILQALSIVLVIYILSKHDNPTYKIAWIIPILVFPVFGGVFYLLFGKKNISKKLTKKIQEIFISTTSVFHANYLDVYEEIKSKDLSAAKQIKYIQDKALVPAFKNTYSKFLTPGETKFEVMVEELKKAKKFIFLEYFIIEKGIMWDRIEAILEEKVKEGVEVRLMFDDLGCITTLPKKFTQTMNDKGIKTRAFNLFKPSLDVFMNYRDHRKICVIDGNVGFTGGINLADEYINAYAKHGYWKDSSIILKGDAVFNLTILFLQLWQHSETTLLSEYEKYKPTVSYPSDGYVQPFGDSPIDNDLVGETTYMNMINNAKKYVYISTPYLILDNEMITSLTTASQSGIDVRITTPHLADKWYVHAVTRSNYQRLVAAGVKIYEYLPGFLHAKTIVSDDEYAIVGTTNFDFRSFYLHFECGVFLYKTSSVTQVYNDYLEILKVSKEITLEECKKTKLPTRMVRALINVFSPLM